MEDVQLIRETITRILKSILADGQGVTIDDVADGDGAVCLTKRKRYSIIMMDVHMSRVSGCDASRLIRRHEQEYNRRKAKIVGVTADDHPEIHDFCRHAGMTQVCGGGHGVWPGGRPCRGERGGPDGPYPLRHRVWEAEPWDGPMGVALGLPNEQW